MKPVSPGNPFVSDAGYRKGDSRSIGIGDPALWKGSLALLLDKMLGNLLTKILLTLVDGTDSYHQLVAYLIL